MAWKLGSPLTHAGRQGLVPHAPAAAQAGQGAAAVQGVARVAAEQDGGVREVAPVPQPVAVAGHPGVLALHEVET